MSSRFAIHAAALGLAALAALVGSPAQAANIATIVGAPGSPAWRAACPPAPPKRSVPTGTSQLPNCPGGGAECLHRVVLDSGEFPDATCSDGTPGVFYVRPGSGADVDRWVIHLQGGGACQDYESCLARWCGQQGIYDANKMSSDWTGDGVTDLVEHARGPGIASPNAANAFSTWTHVWVYYCSSDSWLGRATDVPYAGATSFDLDARGHTILYAVRKMLRKQNANPAWTAAGEYAVGDLDDATEIVFTGTSAGAKGAIQNADWFLSVFPDADKSLVVDANFDISDTVLVDNDVWIDEDTDGTGEMNYYSARIGIMNDMWATGGFYNSIDAFVDESCRSVYEPMGRMDRCSEFSTLLRFSYAADPFIETPTFVRADLNDPVVSDTYTEHPSDAGYSLLIGGQFGTATTLQDWSVLLRASLLESFVDHDAVSGVIAPRCGQHVGLEDWNTFMLKLTPDTDETSTPPALVAGTDTSFHDALVTWLNVGGGGRVDIRRLDTDQLATRFSTCM